MSGWRDNREFDRKGKYPCKGCEEREVGCHSKCERFVAEKARADANGDIIRRKRADNAIMGDYIVDRSIRIHNKTYHGGASK